MTWGTFANSIKKAELFSGTPAQIIIALFKSAGYFIKPDKSLNEGTVNKWIAGERKCKVSSYFPEGELGNSQEAYKFFRNRPDDKLKELQKIFREKKDSDSPIDCETKNLDRFCWSLVNQFIDILGFQRLDMPLEDNADNIEDDIDNDNDADQSRITLPKENTQYLDKIELKPLIGLSAQDMSRFLSQKSIEDVKKELQKKLNL